MRSVQPDRGQAAVEAVALWLIIAAVAALLLLGLPRLGPVIAGVLDGGSGPPAEREPAAAALAEQALAGRAGRGGTPTLLAAERMLALQLGADGARSYLLTRLLARHGARLGHAIDATFVVGGAEAPGDRLIAYPSATPGLEIAHLSDEPLPQLDAATRRAVVQAGQGAAGTALGLARATRPVGTLLGRIQAGQAVAALLAPSDDVGPAPGRRAGDAVLCEPVELRWTMGGELHRRPLAVALHLVVVRAGRVLDDRLVDGARCA